MKEDPMDLCPTCGRLGYKVEMSGDGCLQCDEGM